MSDTDPGYNVCPECRDGKLLDMGHFHLCERCGSEVAAP